jgi:hypothetical protein
MTGQMSSVTLKPLAAIPADSSGVITKGYEGTFRYTPIGAAAPLSVRVVWLIKPAEFGSHTDASRHLGFVEAYFAGDHHPVRCQMAIAKSLRTESDDPAGFEVKMENSGRKLSWTYIENGVDGFICIEGGEVDVGKLHADRPPAAMSWVGVVVALAIIAGLGYLWLQREERSLVN